MYVPNVTDVSSCSCHRRILDSVMSSSPNIINRLEYISFYSPLFHHCALKNFRSRRTSQTIFVPIYLKMLFVVCLTASFILSILQHDRSVEAFVSSFDELYIFRIYFILINIPSSYCILSGHSYRFSHLAYVSRLPLQKYLPHVGCH